MKKHNILLGTLILSLIAISNMSLTCLGSQSSPLIDSAQQGFIGRLAKQINYAEQNQLAVWPGFHPAAKPTIVQFMTRDMQASVYALNFKPGAQRWKKISIENMPVYYLADPSQLNIINDDTFMEIDGQTCFVDIERPDFSGLQNLRPKIIANEASTYLKNESAVDPAKAKYLSIHYDNFNNKTLLKLFYLEDRALTLSAQDDTGLAEEALRHAVAIHQYRNQLIDDSAREFENGLEIMDGIPIFIGWNAQQLNNLDYRKMSQRTGCPPLNSLLGSLGMFDCVMSGFPAFASSTYGRALDKKIDTLTWKQKVEKEFQSPSQLAIAYYHFSDDEAKQLTEAAMQDPQYNYDRIVKIVDHMMDPYLKALEIAKTNYQQLPGIELRLPFEFGYLIMLLNAINGGDNIANFYIVNNHILLLEDINVYSDDNVFSFDHLPYLSINEITNGFDVDEINSYTSIKISENAKLVFDSNAPMSVKEFIRNKSVKSFHQLFIGDKYTRLSLYRNGTLDASQGVLILKQYKLEKMANIKMKHFKEWIHEKINLSH